MNLRVLKERDFDKFKNDYQDKVLTSIEAALIRKKGSKDRVALFKVLTEYLKSKNKSKLADLESLQKHLFIRHLPYKDIIIDIKTNNPAKFKSINLGIEKVYKDKIFILKQGELEDYINIEKGLEHVIEFCRTNIEKYFNKKSSKPYLQELKIIFDNILKD